MQKLVNGVHQFHSTVFRPNQDFFNRLAKGQNPQALFVSCSDSRMVPEMITQADPGDLFVLRNVGNLIPAFGNGMGTEAAAIEYAVRALGVQDIIVCGHTKCGAMNALMRPQDLEGMPRVEDWLKHATASREIVESVYGHLEGDARWIVTVEENVLVQLENLRTHPAVAVALANDQLRLHGWVYKMETGQIFGYESESEQFVPLSRAESEANTPDVRKDDPQEAK